jgi:hypothetical protein
MLVSLTRLNIRDKSVNASLNRMPVFDKISVLVIIPIRRCGVEQRQLVGLITRRSDVRIVPPLLWKAPYIKGLFLCVPGNKSNLVVFEFDLIWGKKT